MNFKIVIPSYCRSHIICDKTLRVCCQLASIPQQLIYVFVLDCQKNSYKVEVEKRNFGDINLISAPPEIPPGLHHMRNYITQYFPEGEHLLHMDDDIDDILKLYIDESITDPKKSTRYRLFSCCNSNPLGQGQGIISIFNNAFRILQDQHIGLFGIYPVANGYFMKDLPDVTYSLRFCVGTLWGCINDHSIIIQIEEKEDVERTLLSFQKYNKILRLNNITIKTKYYKTEGGMQTESSLDKRKAAAKASCIYLLEKYPKYTKLYTSKKSGIYEIKLSN